MTEEKKDRPKRLRRETVNLHKKLDLDLIQLLEEEQGTGDDAISMSDCIKGLLRELITRRKRSRR